MLLSSQGTLYQSDNTHILAGQTLFDSTSAHSTTGTGEPADFKSLNFDPTVFEADLKFGSTILGWDGFFPTPFTPSQFPSQKEISLNNSLSGLLTAELFYEIENYTKTQKFKKNINAWKLLQMYEPSSSNFK